MSDYSENASENPASKADGKSLAVLFRTDPLDLTKEDRQTVITAMRKQRTEFIASGGGKKKKASKKKAASKAVDIDVDTLDIDI